MDHKKPAITGSVDKDQLDYETNFNPESVSYVGPRVVTNHSVVETASTEETETIQ